jgi:hypothetical protein
VAGGECGCPGEEVEGICCCHGCKVKVGGRWRPLQQQFVAHSANKIILTGDQTSEEYCHAKCSSVFYAEEFGWVQCNPAAGRAVFSPEGVCPPLVLPNGRVRE